MNVVTTKDLDAFLARAQSVVDKHMATLFPNLPSEKLSYSVGKKYARFVRSIAGVPNGGGSAYCFIDMNTGDVLKPDGWKRPAKHARGNLFDANNGMLHIGPYGPAYLK